MSRYNTKTKKGTTVAYGYDHACGYFYQEFDEHDDCTLDLDSQFNGLTGSKLAERLGKTNANRDHINKASLDLPF